MKIYLHEIKEQETHLEFTESEKWVSEAVSRLDETDTVLPKKNRPVDASFDIRMIDEVVLVSGKVETHLNLVCSRCANPFSFANNPRFSALFCKDPDMAGIAHLPSAQAKPVGQNHGFARHAHNFDEDAEESTGNESGKDIDITYIAADFIDLAEIMAEQLLLQIPFQPLCKEECLGICSHCGADLNIGRCACAKTVQAKPLAVLRNLKF